MSEGTRKPTPVRLVAEEENALDFDATGFWIGQHVVDEDILVFDPDSMGPTTSHLTLYSLTQHRARLFPKDAIQRLVRPLADELAMARAKREYAMRAELAEAHREAVDVKRSDRMQRLRDVAIAAHRRHVEELGLEYQGLAEPGAPRTVGRVTRCHVCGIELDDFTGAACAICSVGLCSCGACACGRQTRGRRTKPSS